MTVKATCVTSPWDIEWPLIAGYYWGEPSSSISEGPLSALISIGDFDVGFDNLFANGKVTTKTTKKYYDEYDISTISLKASGSGFVLE
jgi:hypothetical protein